MRTAIIFGVSGQDGAFLSKLLLEKKYCVVGISRDCQKNRFHNLERLGICNRVKLVQSSMDDVKNIIQILTIYRPDEVYNLSGQSSVGLSFKQPFETIESIARGTLTLLEAIRLVGLSMRLFNAGSGDCFGNTGGARATESTPFAPQSPYGVAKAAAFWQVASYRVEYDIFACTGILFNHESFLRPDTFVTQKIVITACRIANGSREKLVLGNLSIERDWGWAPEYVNAMWMMLREKQPDDYIIATGATGSLKNFVGSVFERIDLNWR